MKVLSVLLMLASVTLAQARLPESLFKGLDLNLGQESADIDVVDRSHFQNANHAMLEQTRTYYAKSEMAEMHVEGVNNNADLLSDHIEYVNHEPVEMVTVSPALLETESAADSDAETDIEVLDHTEAETDDALESELMATEEADKLTAEMSEFEQKHRSALQVMSQAEAEAEAETEVDAEAEAEAEVDAEAEVEAGAEAGAEVEVQLDAGNSNSTEVTSVTPKANQTLTVTDEDRAYYKGQRTNRRYPTIADQTYGKVEAIERTQEESAKLRRLRDRALGKKSRRRGGKGRGKNGRKLNAADRFAEKQARKAAKLAKKDAKRAAFKKNKEEVQKFYDQRVALMAKKKAERKAKRAEKKAAKKAAKKARFAQVEQEIMQETQAEHELEHMINVEAAAQGEVVAQLQAEAEAEAESEVAAESEMSVEHEVAAAAEAESTSKTEVFANTEAEAEAQAMTECKNAVCPRAPRVSGKKWVRPELRDPKKKKFKCKCYRVKRVCKCKKAKKQWTTPAFHPKPKKTIRQRLHTSRRQRRKQAPKWVKPITKPYGYFDNANVTSTVLAN